MSSNRSPILPADGLEHYRVRSPKSEILFDLLPLGAFFAFWIWFLSVYLSFRFVDSIFNGLAVYVYVSPLATGIWALVRIAPQLQSLCSLQRREELSLTEIDVPHWLSANLRHRLIRLLALPMLNVLTLAPFCFVWALTNEVDPLRPGGRIWVFFLVSIYAFSAMQLCAIAATLAGVFNILERLCHREDATITTAFMIAKASLVLILSPVLVIIGCFITMGIGALFLPIVCLIIFPRRLRHHWNLAVERYLNLDAR